MTILKQDAALLKTGLEVTITNQRGVETKLKIYIFGDATGSKEPRVILSEGLAQDINPAEGAHFFPPFFPFRTVLAETRATDSNGAQSVSLRHALVILL